MSCVIMEKLDDTRLLCLNVNGIRSSARMNSFTSTHLYLHHGPSPDIFCIQESHSTPDMEKDYLVCFQYDCAFFHSAHNQGGLITGFHRTLDYCVHAHVGLGETPRDTKPQVLMVHCTVKQMEMIIVNVYIPPNTVTSDRIEFFTKLEQEWQQFGCSNIICCGDFNTVLDPYVDAVPPFSDTLTRNSVVFQSFVDTTELIDTFRIYNPITRRFTYFTSRLNTGKRLDYILASGSFLNLTEQSEILPKMMSDHNPCLLTLAINRNPKGRGYWRFPNAVLANEHYVKWLKEQIKESILFNAEGTPPRLIMGYN